MNPTRIDLIIAADTQEKIISLEFKGGIKRSTIFPCILEPNIEEDVFANAFWLLNACNGIKKIIKTKNKRIKNF